MRCDLHVHSKYSRDTSLWVLRTLNVPESFTPPQHVYDQAVERGMDLVTITDINTIEGVLEISDRPGVFLSEEVTALLPESRAVVHLLVFGITETQHEEISKLREDLNRLVDYLRDRGIPYSLAHPFHFPGSPLSLDEFRYVLDRMQMVESLSGSRSRVENEAVPQVVRAIRSAPGFDGFTGGSDDHCGRFLGLTWTTVPGAGSMEDYLEGLREGDVVPQGRHGSAIRSAYSVYSIAYSFYRDRMLSRKLPRYTTDAADRFFKPGTGSEAEPTLWHKADYLVRKLLGRASASSDLEEVIHTQLLEIGRDLWIDSRQPGESIDQRTFEILSNLTNRLTDRLISLLFKSFRDGNLLQSIEATTALAPVLLATSPYPLFYFVSRRGREAVSRVSRATVGEDLGRRDPGKRAWFTDTIDDLNGVSRTLQRFSDLAMNAGRRMAVVACQKRPLSFPGWVVNFPPIKEFPIPDYTSKTLSVPPFLEVLRFIDENQFGMLYVSTPGPVGLVALLAGKLLGIPCVGIHHTDFTRHVTHIVQDARMGEMASAYTGWFFSSMDRVLVPSRFYMEDLRLQGVPAESMRIFPRGIDTDKFSPRWRSEEFFGEYGASGSSTRLIYVGRVSREKDLDVLAEALLRLRGDGRNVELFVVGDGPYLRELVGWMSGKGCFFTGVLRGERLSRAYASGDVFVFPSTTDTFGNVVLEAHASGVPAVVTDKGGPQEIIENGKTGLVARGRDVEDLVEKIDILLDDPGRRAKMGKAARKLALSRTWESAFDRIWGEQVQGLLD
ncbi:glycosyltransferase [Candidatus Fermentibacteria bacterium]|nr:glycosyltransferase [Candidatus Fermentibacteria bacterium]